jgi:hypothetical protein
MLYSKRRNSFTKRVAEDAFSKEKAKEWLENTLTALWEGDTCRVITACEILAPNSEIASLATTNFRNNAHRMQYDHFRNMGYMIGSGTIESGCNRLSLTA